MIDTYTRLLEASAKLENKEISDAAVTKLIVHLKSAGRMKMLPQIARELRKIATRRHTLRPYVEVAHEKEVLVALAAAAKEGIVAQKATINKQLIHGWRARSGDKLVDHSAKCALLHIYQKVTA